MLKNTAGKKENRRAEKRAAAALILFVISLCAMILAKENMSFAVWYSENVYRVLVSFLGRISGMVPFSVSEILIYLLVFVLVSSFFRMIFKIIKLRRKDKFSKGKRRGIFVSWFSNVFLGAGILLFLYVSCCGINYYRSSFSEEEKIEEYEYSAEELKQTCIRLTEEVGYRADQVLRDSMGVMKLEGPEEESAVEAMYKAGMEYESLRGYYPRPKKLLFSEILSYQGLTGIYLPFTVEANYNGDMTAYNKPFTACHELSHLRGFMQEQEANYIAFLACIKSERTDFQYSGYLSAWVYCMNALYRTDQESWAEVRKMMDGAAEPDLKANHDFWEQHEGKISETAEQINDTYLKVNGQAEGVKSYDRMVDLVVSFYKNDSSDQ